MSRQPYYASAVRSIIYAEENLGTGNGLHSFQHASNLYTKLGLALPKLPNLLEIVVIAGKLHDDAQRRWQPRYLSDHTFDRTSIGLHHIYCFDNAVKNMPHPVRSLEAYNISSTMLLKRTGAFHVENWAWLTHLRLSLCPDPALFSDDPCKPDLAELRQTLSKLAELEVLQICFECDDWIHHVRVEHIMTADFPWKNLKRLYLGNIIATHQSMQDCVLESGWMKPNTVLELGHLQVDEESVDRLMHALRCSWVVHIRFKGSVSCGPCVWYDEDILDSAEAWLASRHVNEVQPLQASRSWALGHASHDE